MNTNALFNFVVEPGGKTITVERSFNAPLAQVWSAWTDPEILCQWWAPKPYTCVIKSLDFREGGRWLYCMEGPEGDRHWALFDYAIVRPMSFYSGTDAFCDESGSINTSMPSTQWENHFKEKDGTTLVRCKLHCASAQAAEQLMKMGFKEGFTLGLEQLDELLASGK
jgi:PhnB protein